MNLSIEKWLIGILLVLGLPLIGNAQDKTASTGNWHNAGTWTPNGVPGDDDIILIPTGSVVTVNGTDDTLNDAIMIVEGELVMESPCEICSDYASLTFTGPSSGVIIEDGGKVTDGTLVGGDSHFIAVQGEQFWSGDNCFSNCGATTGSYTASGSSTSEPEDLSNPLPVEMLFFTGNFKEASVLLEWATATELNNCHFKIERSLGNNFDFQELGEVKGRGNSSARVDYSFRDHGISVTDHKIYYRIKQVDFDGKYEYSNIIAVQNQPFQAIGLKTWPNPFAEELTVILNALSPDNINIRLYDIKGREVFSQVYAINEGLNELKIVTLHDAPPGVYVLYLTGNSLFFKEKVIKSR